MLLTAQQTTTGSSSLQVGPWIWGGFVAIIVALLIVDLRIMGGERRIGTRQAAVYSAVWISLGLLFGGVVWLWQGASVATEYLTGYVIEKSLSMDNVFLWAVLFAYFSVPDRLQHRVLFWGVFGALVMRAAFIFAGVALLRTIEWIVYVFAVILLATAYRLAVRGDIEMDPETNPILRRVRQVIPQTKDYRGKHFFVSEGGGLKATPLFVVVLTIELTDVIFAIDSIPAILAITRKEFIVFSSNAFAILGLRALYFLLAGMRDRFVHLDKGLAAILAFVGAKFVIDQFVHIPIWVSLGVIATILGLTIWLSLRAAPQRARSAPREGDGG